MHNLNERARGSLSVLLALMLAGTLPVPAQTPSNPPIDLNNWASVTAPVYGTSEGSPVSGTELFAGPNKFGSYYSGVLPNGRIVKPAGTSIQVGMNPLNAALTPDGKYLVTSNDDEREGGYASLQSGVNIGGYSLTVIDTASMTVVSQVQTTARFFIGLQITGTGPYTVWASGGADQNINLFSLGSDGSIAPAKPDHITIKPIQASGAGYVSNYTPDASFNTADASGSLPPVPTGFDRKNGAKITFPAGSALSPDGKYLYVACNGDNSVAVIDTAQQKVVRQVEVGYFPYGVALNAKGDRVLVSNWGITEYQFWGPSYDPDTGNLTALAAAPANQPDGFYVPNTSISGSNPRTSSVSILSAPGGNGASLRLVRSLYQGKPLDSLTQVGDAHPSAIAVVKQGSTEVLYVTKSNSDALGLIRLSDNSQLPDLDLSPVSLTAADKHPIHGAYPNALAVSPDNKRLYVAEAGLNSVAVIDTTDPTKPKLTGRIGTGWYPAGLAASADGKYLYITNAKGIGEDINPNTDTSASHKPSGVASHSVVDSNYIFGSVQKVDLSAATPDSNLVLRQNYTINRPFDTSIVPTGGAASAKIKHVFFILHENKTFDSMLGNLSAQFGTAAGTTFNDQQGKPYTNKQYTGVSLNTQMYATKFATAVNYYSDSEESDAGHQFAASGTATDYTEKTLLVKSGRGVLVNKNFEPEDYPESGYIFNNAARNGVTFKDYGALIRIASTDTGVSTPTTLNDPNSGNSGYPQLQTDKFSVTSPLANAGDVDSPTLGLGQSYFLALPVLAVLGTSNPGGEPRLDANYPGYNFNISDQRRAKEFNADFDRMVAAGTLPQFIYIYQPNDHTGGVQAPNASVSGTSALNQIADGDVGLGMVVNHSMNSPVYYDPATDTGSAIFITYDDAQSSLDHIHPHRTPLIVVSPFARPGYVAKRHYSTASVVKTEELLLGLPPNNLGDLFATDLRDMFQPTYNGITAAQVGPTRIADYRPSPENLRIWQLASKLDTSAPDRDSKRLGALIRLTIAADDLHNNAEALGKLKSRAYRNQQKKLYQAAVAVVNGPKPKDSDD